MHTFGCVFNDVELTLIPVKYCVRSVKMKKKRKVFLVFPAKLLEKDDVRKMVNLMKIKKEGKRWTKRISFFCILTSKN